jgi:hypothetical protein
MSESNVPISSHTEHRHSFAPVIASTGQDHHNNVTLFCRGKNDKNWKSAPLHDTPRLRDVIATSINSISTAPTRTILLNDDLRVDMPAVTIEDLVRMVRGETVRGGQGRQTDVFVVVYDRDPTMPIAERSPGVMLATAGRGTGADGRKERGCCCVM